MFGEKDPDFNYDTEVVEATIADLRDNFSSYSTGVTMKLKAQVIRKVGSSLYIEDLEETLNEDTGESSKAGIFLYHSFASGMEVIKIGDVIEFNCQAADTTDYGRQLVNPHKIRIRDSGTEVMIRDVDEDAESLQSYEGYVVRIKEFTVEYVGKPAAANGAYTIRGTLKSGAEVQVRLTATSRPNFPANSSLSGRSMMLSAA